MRQSKQRIDRIEKRLTKQTKWQSPPDPMADELGFLEWHYSQLTSEERAEHDAVLESLIADLDNPLPSPPENHEFDISPQHADVDTTKPHLPGCSCFRCVQRRQFYRGIGF